MGGEGGESGWWEGRVGKVVQVRLNGEGGVVVREGWVVREERVGGAGEVECIPPLPPPSLPIPPLPPPSFTPSHPPSPNPQTIPECCLMVVTR